jgi:hypothetical protein
MLILSSTYWKTKIVLNLKQKLTGKSETLGRGWESGNTALEAGAGSAAKFATTGWLLRSSLVVTMATGVTELLAVGVPRPPLCWFPLQCKSTYSFHLVHYNIFQYSIIHVCIMWTICMLTQSHESHTVIICLLTLCKHSKLEMNVWPEGKTGCSFKLVIWYKQPWYTDEMSNVRATLLWPS